MAKTKITSIRINAALYNEAKELGLNVSKISENALKDAIARLKGKGAKSA